MGSRDDDWVTVEGVRYVPEAPLKAEIERLQNVIKDQRAELDKLGDRFDTQSDEIADLQSANKLLHNLVANREAQIEKLRAALEEISNYGYDVENDDAYPLKEIARKALKEGK